MSEELFPHHHHSHEEEENLIEHLPNDADLAATADVLKQLGDPSRLKIFWLLCHQEECVIDIASIVQMSSPAVSHHLRILKKAGLITSRREGKEVYYKASDTQIAQSLHLTMEEIMHITCPN